MVVLGCPHILTGRKARKFCTDMLAWLDQKTEIVEHADQSSQYFEPAHAAYYNGKPGQPLKLMLQARSDFLSIWRRADYREHVAEFKLLGRQLIIVNSPDAIRYVVAKRHENFERKTPQMRRALEYLRGDDYSFPIRRPGNSAVRWSPISCTRTACRPLARSCKSRQASLPTAGRTSGRAP